MKIFEFVLWIAPMKKFIYQRMIITYLAVKLISYVQSYVNYHLRKFLVANFRFNKANDTMILPMSTKNFLFFNAACNEIFKIFKSLK